MNGGTNPVTNHSNNTYTYTYTVPVSLLFNSTTSKFNTSYNSLAYLGYMYGTPYTYTNKSMSSDTNSYVYGNSVTYNNGTYTLTNTISGTYSSLYNGGLNNNH